MAINRAPWNALVDDDGSNLVGTVWNKDKIKTVLLDPIDATTGVPWVDIPFSASRYTANVGTWTVTAGQQRTLRYARIGDFVAVLFAIDQGVLSAAAARLDLNLSGVIPISSVYTVAAFSYYGSTSAVAGTGALEIGAGGTTLIFYRSIATPPFSAEPIYIRGQVVYATT